jgi:hypothetical protein
MATCVGPPDSIIIGSTGVLIGGMQAARMGDQTAHGGIITLGCMTVLIGDQPGGGAAGGGGGGGASTASASAKSAAVAMAGGGKEKGKTHWLDVQFVDKMGYPISGVDYELTGTDGKKTTGRLGGNGKIRRDGIDPGNCTVKLFSVHNARWSKDKARVGDKVKLTADVIGFDSGTEAVFEIWERDTNSPDDFIDRIETKTKGDKVEVEWEYQYKEDEDDIQTEEEKKKGYSAPEYYFIVTVERSEAKSDLLEYRDTITIELKDEDDKPVAEAEYILHLPNGEVRKGTLDKNGTKEEKGIPPKGCRVQFPGFSVFKDVG